MAYFKNSLSYKIAIVAIIGALYTVLVWFLPYLSFAIWQVRIADCLIPQVFILGWPCIGGITLGGFIGNLASPYPIDPIVGPLANFLAGLAGYLIEKRNNSTGLLRIIRTQFAIFVQTLINTFVVGTILAVVTSMEIGDPISLPILISWWIGIFIGSLIAMNILGFLLFEALRKTQLFEVQKQTDNLQTAVNYLTMNFVSK